LKKKVLGSFEQTSAEARTKATAMIHSLRPSRYAPAFGRAEPTHPARCRAMNGAQGKINWIDSKPSPP
jgi:hypothetical protein